MYRLGKTLGRLGSARALLAGAAILAGAAGPVADKIGSVGSKRSADAAEDTAIAIPRIGAPGGASRVALPQPLAPSDAERIRRIFALQAKSDIPSAIAEVEQLTDTTVLPEILADRYLNSPQRARTEDLEAWLARYANLPDAPAIHGLLQISSPKAAARIGSPTPLPALPAPSRGDDVEQVERILQRNPKLDRSVHEAARSSSERALRLIARARGLDRIYGAQLRAEVAQIQFTLGNDADAYGIAEAAHRQAAGEVGLAPYVAGLAAWRMERFELARTMFEAAFRAQLAQPGQRAGAAFWAARTWERDHLDEQRDHWMRRAAENGRTFYGLLARRAIGRALDPQPTVNALTLGEADVEAIDATTNGRRAFALLQVGQDTRAAFELQALWSQTRDNPGMAQSIMLVARQAGLITLASQLAMLIAPTPVHLPEHELRPASGFHTDPALIYALARLESNFDPRAVSRAGARGLMQLMPSTADFIMGGTSPNRLHDPAVSLDIGQRYLMVIAQYDLIGGDLIRLLAGYNSGTGSLGKWIGGVRHNGDPLMFLESVPNGETRSYIPRALAYTWLYAVELGLPSPSLDELAAGGWPRFRHDEPSDAVVARLQ